METKVCNKCNVEKDVTEFYSGRRRCKLCYNIHKKKKAGKKMRKKGEKGAPTEKAIKRSQKTSKKP